MSREPLEEIKSQRKNPRAKRLPGHQDILPPALDQGMTTRTIVIGLSLKQLEPTSRVSRIAIPLDRRSQSFRSPRWSVLECRVTKRR